MSRPVRTGVFVVLVLLVAADTWYSFLQHYHQPLDGDVAWNLVPAEEVRPVLQDPLGLQTWMEGRIYPNPNRFFCHWSFRAYLLHSPRFLQHFTDPVTSVYLAAGIARLLTQVLLLLLLARAVTGGWQIQKLPFWAALAILVPFFQANGYRSHLGIVDPSVTYTFFYALPAAALVALLLPFIDRLYHGRKDLSVMRMMGYGVLAVVVTLSGPLNPGAIGALSAVALLAGVTYRNGWDPQHRRYFILWGWGAGLAVYSLYVGSYNSLTITNALPLAERYAVLPEGVFRQFTGKLAWPVLFAGLGVNYFLLRRSAGGNRIEKAYAYVVLFSLLYILLLPLGGYREYRPFILRYDTVLPVTLALVGLYTLGSLHLLRRYVGRARWSYALLPAAVAAIFTFADEPGWEHRDCEEASLRYLATTTQDTVALTADCPVIGWGRFAVPAESEENNRLLQLWGISERPVRYYHQEQ